MICDKLDVIHYASWMLSFNQKSCFQHFLPPQCQGRHQRSLLIWPGILWQNVVNISIFFAEYGHASFLVGFQRPIEVCKFTCKGRFMSTFFAMLSCLPSFIIRLPDLKILFLWYWGMEKVANDKILFLVITHRASLLGKIKIAFGRMIQVQLA